MNEDLLRQQKLESLGYRVLRFTNDEVLNKKEEVLQIIQSNVLKMAQITDYSLPLVEGEGSGLGAFDYGSFR